MHDSADDPGLCGACAGTAPQTPAAVSNRAGLSAIGYRVGTQPRFLASMQARLGALPELRARDSGDFTIALLDAFSCMADVLTFYQERIANESFLRTATERRSLVLLGELVGYAPQPGVAASAWLAFTMTAAPGAPASAAAAVDVPAGTRVQSLPAPGALPQTFETSTSVPARVEWNAMRPSLSRPQPVDAAARGLLFSGIATGLKPGDCLVIVPDDAGSRPVLRTVAAVTPLPARQQTWVALRPPTADSAAQPAAPPAAQPAALAPVPPPAPTPPLPAAPLRPLLRHRDLAAEARALQHIRTVPLTLAAPRAALTDWSALAEQATVHRSPFVVAAADLAVLGWRLRLRPPQLFASLAAWSAPVVPSVYALRTRASLFAYNAPDPHSLGKDTAAQYTRNLNTGDWLPPSTRTRPVLDASYPRLAAASTERPSWAALQWADAQGEQWLLGSIDAAADAGMAACTLTGRVTRLQLTPLNDSDGSQRLQDSFSDFNQYRGTSVLAESEPLALARLPRDDEPLPAASVIDLDTWVDGLSSGQYLAVSGELAGSRGTWASEVVRIQSVDHVIAAGGYTSLTLDSALRQAYVRETVTLNGNVAPASHGQAVQEVLGSGDTSQRSQRFTLRQSPLTYTSAATASGVAASLAVRVNGLLWREVADFVGSGPDDRVYTLRREDDGNTSVVFGDGINGEQPPTGVENIVASYRKGIGAVGNVAAATLTLLQTRPLGVQAVGNPVPASGGTDPEAAADIRANAALGLRTLGRVVSLQDHEDFARAFGGIAKALATWTRHGRGRGVLLTVAGADGADVPPGDPIGSRLLAALADAAQSQVPLRLASYRRAAFTFGATLWLDPAHDRDTVLAAAEARARAAYAFDRRAFGQPVTRSDVTALLQATPGVVAVQVTALRRTDTALFVRADAARGALREQSRIDAALPQRADEHTVLAAELLTLDPRPLALVALWAEVIA